MFKESEYQFYKGVLYFYAKEYESAEKNFERSLALKEKHIEEMADENNEDCLEFYKLSYNNLSYNYY